MRFTLTRLAPTLAAAIVLAVLAAAAAAPTPVDASPSPAFVLPPENTLARCTDGRDNDRDGLIDENDPDCDAVLGGGGGGGGGDEFPRIFNVTLSSSGGPVADPGSCNNADGQCDNQAVVDEDKGQSFNTSKKNPGDRYNTMANLYVLNDINVKNLVLTDVAGGGSCTDFFRTRGGTLLTTLPAGGPDSGEVYIDDVAGTVTWSGFMQASISLDLLVEEGKYERRIPNGVTLPTWTELDGPRFVKGRITAPNFNWNLRFDYEWRPDGSSVVDTFLPLTAADGTIYPFDLLDSNGQPGTDGLNDEWDIAIGRVLAQSWSGDGAGALCDANFTVTVTRN